MSVLVLVNDVHAGLRPVIFVNGLTKYDEAGLTDILHDPQTPVFVAIDADGGIAGYCFCIIEDHSAYVNLRPIKTLYIDDLCGEEMRRGSHVGRMLFEYVTRYAKEEGFYNVTLNVWSGNDGALKFYEAMGMRVMKTTMEVKLIENRGFI